jgi:hypothetical protein
MAPRRDLGRLRGLVAAATCTLAWAALCPAIAAAAEAKAAVPPPLLLGPGEPLPEGKWVDVMTPVDPDWDTVSGAWHRGAWDGLSGTWRQQGTHLTVEHSNFQRIMLPVELEGSYELKVEFTRRSGNYGLPIVFPVGRRSCVLSLADRWDTLHGLSLVDGRKTEGHSNPAVYTPGKLVNLQRYGVLLAVQLEGSRVKVDVSLDGQPIISWSGRQESLDVEPMFTLPKPYRPALAANDTDLVYYSALVRASDGKARMAPPHVSPKVDLDDRGWVDLLKDVDPDRDAINGRWVKLGGGIEVAPVSHDTRYVRLMLPRSIDGSYDLVVDFTRTKGFDSVTFALPAGARQCALHLSAWAGHSGGLEAVDRLTISDICNPALRHPSSLVNGQRHRLLAQVRTREDNAVVDTWLDGKPFVHWAGKQSSLDISKEWSLPERWRAAVGANQCGVTFHAVRLRPVQGEPAAAERVRKDER